jgi:hypothetical protein
MDLRKIGFQLPETIKFDEETLNDTYGKLVAEPLERGFGTTLGNALRRILLSKYFNFIRCRNWSHFFLLFIPCLKKVSLTFKNCFP